MSSLHFLTFAALPLTFLCSLFSLAKRSKMPGPQQHKKEHDPTAHVMDYPALDLGNKHCSKTHVAIVDLDVYVWGLEEIKGSKLPIAAVVS